MDRPTSANAKVFDHEKPPPPPPPRRGGEPLAELYRGGRYRAMDRPTSANAKVFELRGLRQDQKYCGYRFQPYGFPVRTGSICNCRGPKYNVILCEGGIRTFETYT